MFRVQNDYILTMFSHMLYAEMITKSSSFFWENIEYDFATMRLHKLLANAENEQPNIVQINSGAALM